MTGFRNQRSGFSSALTSWVRLRSNKPPSGAPAHDDEKSWIRVFPSFFSEVQKAIDYSWAASLRNLGEDIIDFSNVKPQFWKASGDEALYRVNINHPYDALFAVASFREAALKVRRTLREESPKLDIKAAAWLAGFPVNNVEVVLGAAPAPSSDNPVTDDWWVEQIAQRMRYEDGNKSDGVLDFLGPQIDLGFRLATKATPRRMILSADLAHLIIGAYKAAHDKWTGRFSVSNRLFFDGTDTLKGVLSGEPYPIIWWDMLPEHPVYQAEYTALKRAPTAIDDLESYCKAFIEDARKEHPWMILPFIKNGEGTVIHGVEADSHRDILKMWADRWEHARKTLDDHEPSATVGNRHAQKGDEITENILHWVNELTKKTPPNQEGS